MSMNATAEQHELEVIEVPDEGPVPDVHQGRPMRPVYAERGERFQLAYERGLPVGVLL